MTLGATIRHLRQSARLSQADLAKRLEISSSYLSLVEGDHRDASIPLLRRLAAELGAPAALLFAAALAGSKESPPPDEIALALEKLVDAIGMKKRQSEFDLTA